jgi:hypothetical protein
MVAELDRLIKARHVQLGGYLHDADEHLLEAKRLMTQERRELGARDEIRLSLECRAMHAREKTKYDNLVGLRKIIREAKENLSMAQLLEKCSLEVQATLEQMPDVMELRQKWAVSDEDDTIELPSVPSQPQQTVTVTDQEVARALEQLRAPIPANAIRVPLLSSQ